MSGTWYEPWTWFNSGPTPTPMNFANGAPVPGANPGANPSGSASPIPTGTPGGPGASQFTSAQQAQIQNALDAAGIWGTIQNLGGDVWGTIAKILPKNADGSIDWGGTLKDIGSWVKNNAKTIVDAASAYSQYQRQNTGLQLGQQAVDMAKQSYADRAPLRAAGQAGMLNPQANTPDLSSLKSGIPKAQQAPLPVAGSHQNLNNAQQIAGPNSGNPFAPKTAPTPLPVGGAPGTPQMPPMRPMTPQAPTPLPIASQPTPAQPTNGPPPQMIGMAPQLPTAPGTPQTPPQPLPISFAPQSGKIRNGPQDRTLPSFPPLPVAGY